jgi:hypothetical protein
MNNKRASPQGEQDSSTTGVMSHGTGPAIYTGKDICVCKDGQGITSRMAFR